MNNITQPNYLQKPIAVGLLLESVIRLPQVGDSSSPMLDVQQNHIVDVIQVDYVAINLDLDYLFEGFRPRLEEIGSSHLSVDQFVAEL